MKASPPCLAAWAAVLAAVPGSRLALLPAGGEPTHAYARGVLARHGLDPGRVDLLPRGPRADYLRFFDRIDVALDPFPFNGITTTCDGLWRGVPCVSLAGDRFAGRAGVSLLTAVGLGDLVAVDVPAYVRVAAALAADRGRLTALRRALPARAAASPLGDRPAFARKWEAALLGMWRARAAS